MGHVALCMYSVNKEAAEQVCNGIRPTMEAKLQNSIEAAPCLTHISLVINYRSLIFSQARAFFELRQRSWSSRTRMGQATRLGTCMHMYITIGSIAVVSIEHIRQMMLLFTATSR